MSLLTPAGTLLFAVLLMSTHVQCKPQRQHSSLRHRQRDVNGQMREPINVDNLKPSKSPTSETPAKPVAVPDWPSAELSVGQISAVSIDADNNPVIFHRATHTWESDTFNMSNHYQHILRGPIQADTILTLDKNSGEIMSGKGANLFYMPHGMTIDAYGHFWVTDVALHQVFKFHSDVVEPSIVIGVPFTPGSSSKHLCMPTSVAVASSGEVFVSDGYCNSRILKFNAAGRILRIIPQAPEFISLQVPHGLTLLEDQDLVCVADRENMRVVCPNAGLDSTQIDSALAYTIQEPDLGRVFDVASHGKFVYAVNGPTSAQIDVGGFTIDPLSEQIVDHWGTFTNPHSIAIDANGTVLYVSEIGPNKLWKFQLN